MDLCLFGGPKAGKTSIVKVVFQKKINPQQTILLEQTKKMEVTQVKRGFIDYRVFDFPSGYRFKDSPPAEINRLDRLGALIYVLNLRDMAYDFQQFIEDCKYIKAINPNVTFHVFLHKIDIEGGEEEKKNQLLSETKKKLEEEGEMAGLGWKIQYYLTSIYDYSLMEAFSKVIQKLVPQVPFLTKALDDLLLKCKLEKVFLFEIISKLYLATDQQTFNSSNFFSICSEMIDVFMDISFSNKKDRKPDAKSVITLSYGGDKILIMLYEVQKFFALMFIIKQTNYDHPYIIDRNIEVLQKGISEMFQL